MLGHTLFKRPSPKSRTDSTRRSNSVRPNSVRTPMQRPVQLERNQLERNQLERNQLERNLQQTSDNVPPAVGAVHTYEELLLPLAASEIGLWHGTKQMHPRETGFCTSAEGPQATAMLPLPLGRLDGTMSFLRVIRKIFSWDTNLRHKNHTCTNPQRNYVSIKSTSWSH